MDAIAAEVLSKWYIYFYEQLGQQIHAPTPSQLFDIITALATHLYEFSPPIVRTYYTILNSIPVQTDIIPVALAVLILYAIFAIMLMVIRGAIRLVVGFVRLSIIISLTAALVCVVLQYTGQDTFATFFQSSGTLARQFSK